MAGKRGRLIVFEGLDRTGKSTQAKRLADRLGAAVFKFPMRESCIGQIVDKYLKKEADLPVESAHLLFSANRWEFRRVIESHLHQGQDVVVDRYAFSGVVYTQSQGHAYEWCAKPDQGLPAPDLVLFLSLRDPSTRKDFGDERYEVVETQQKVAAYFEQRFFARKEWKVLRVDGLTIEEVEEMVWAHVDQLQVESNELRRLW